MEDLTISIKSPQKARPFSDKNRTLGPEETPNQANVLAVSDFRVHQQQE